MFSENIKMMYNYVNPVTEKHSPLISKKLRDFVMENAEVLDEAIVDKRDFDYDYFGFKTLERSYLLKIRMDNLKKKRLSNARDRCFFGFRWVFTKISMRPSIHTISCLKNYSPMPPLPCLMQEPIVLSFRRVFY